MLIEEGRTLHIVLGHAAQEDAGRAAIAGRIGLAENVGNGALNAGDLLEGVGETVIARHAVGGLHDDVAGNAEDAAEELGAEAVHHAHDDDEGGNPQDDACDRQRGDHRDGALAPPGAQITPGDGPFERAEGGHAAAP